MVGTNLRGHSGARLPCGVREAFIGRTLNATSPIYLTRISSPLHREGSSAQCPIDPLTTVLMLRTYFQWPQPVTGEVSLLKKSLMAGRWGSHISRWKKIPILAVAVSQPYTVLTASVFLPSEATGDTCSHFVVLFVFETVW